MGEQGLDAKGLMTNFSEIKAQHEKMDAEKFNDDHVYKEKLNEVGPVTA